MNPRLLCPNLVSVRSPTAHTGWEDGSWFLWTYGEESCWAMTRWADVPHEVLWGTGSPEAGILSLFLVAKQMCSQSQDRSSTVPMKTGQEMNTGLPAPIWSHVEQAAAHKSSLDYVQPENAWTVDVAWINTVVKVQHDIQPTESFQIHGGFALYQPWQCCFLGTVPLHRHRFIPAC